MSTTRYVILVVLLCLGSTMQFVHEPLTDAIRTYTAHGMWPSRSTSLTISVGVGLYLVAIWAMISGLKAFFRGQLSGKKVIIAAIIFGVTHFVAIVFGRIL